MYKKMQQEALSRLTELTKKYDLSPSILTHFRNGLVYYSYITAGGMLPSVDTITYKREYEDAVHRFEEATGFLVYHAIEAQTWFGMTLSLLYVGKKEVYWESERLCGNCISTYTINLSNPDFSEFGDIEIGASEPHGALVRRWQPAFWN